MVYLHVPFCKRFCTYCAFYSELFRETDARAYADALCREIRARRQEILSTSDVPTLYIGGGTPSVLPPSVLRRIVEELSLVTGGRYAEWTVEVNPDDITPAYAAFLKNLGVGRVSMGIQSFDDATLRKMARRHTAAGAAEAFRMLREAGFDNISVDLIFGTGPGLPDSDLDALLSLPGGPPEHVSAYQLSVEEGSALERMVRSGRFREPGERVCEAQYRRICTRLAEAGYEHYEISNFARRGSASPAAASPYRAVHNSAYWSGAPYVGLGPAAHSYDGGVRSWNPSDLGRWLRQWQSPAEGPAPREGETLSARQKDMERVMLSLRTSDGIPEDLLRRLSGNSRVDALLSQSCLEKTPEFANLRVPEPRWFVSDAIIVELI